MKTPTLDEMKLAVAKMLPDEICVADGHIRWLYGGTPMRPVVIANGCTSAGWPCKF